MGTSAGEDRCGFRVFVSYSHEDYDKAQVVTAALRELGLEPWLDDHIKPGTPFTDAIKGMISHAHVFMPIITPISQQRMWVHQETGFAIGLNIPVLPLAVGKARDALPQAMPAELQAVKVAEDLSDLKKQLQAINWPDLVLPPPGRPEHIVAVAQWPEERAALIAECANRVVCMGARGRMRQIGALSSFCLPDEDIGHPIWQRREGRVKRSDYFHHLQREERRALELHARAEGCDLIIDPSIDFRANGPQARKARLETLLEFLESMKDHELKGRGGRRGALRVAISSRAREINLLLVGDWFVAESQIPRPTEGYRQTIFNWHAPTVLSHVGKFEAEFEELISAPSVVSGCEQVIEQIEGVIENEVEPAIGKRRRRK
ncbi:MAG TPA: toll/interleukin-1 receptor domain-containing protein [Armatimonadota bacterium]|nr:toll/interleukin-1 receptor domain-containing protein [Armatimonadota bacterium]